jgi:hypothetical protein
MFTFRSIKNYTSTDINNILKELLTTITLSEIEKDLLINQILTTYKNGSLRNFVIIELTKFLVKNKLLNSETFNLSTKNIDNIIDEIIRRYRTGDLYDLCIIVLVNFILNKLSSTHKLSAQEINDLTNFIAKIYVSGNIYSLCTLVFNIYNIISINKLSNKEIYKLLNDIINSSNMRSGNTNDYIIIECSKFIFNKLSSNKLNTANIDILTKTALQSYKKYPIKIYIICTIIYNICYLYQLTPNKISQDIIDEVIRIIRGLYNEKTNIDKLCIKEFSRILITKLIKHRISDEDIKKLLKIILELFEIYKEKYLNNIYDIIVNVYNILFELQYEKSYQIIRYYSKFFLEQFIFANKSYSFEMMKDYIETEYNEKSKSINSSELKQLSIGSDKSIRLFFEGRLKKLSRSIDISKFLDDIFKDIFKVIFNRDYNDFLIDVSIELRDEEDEDEDDLDEIHLIQDDVYGYMYNKYIKDKNKEQIETFINYLLNKLNDKSHEFIKRNYYNENILIRDSMRIVIIRKSLKISFIELIDGLYNIINVNAVNKITSRMSIENMINQLYLAIQSNRSPDERYNIIDYVLIMIRSIICQYFLKMIKIYQKKIKHYQKEIRHNRNIHELKTKQTVKRLMERTGNTDKSKKDFVELISSKYK